ncbi:MAG: hypothetical protein CV089_01720 [Nitrospira sp. WS110]|nr:hypothetical protein [Nitrospira sp. WS110]
MVLTFHQHQLESVRTCLVTKPMQVYFARLLSLCLLSLVLAACSKPSVYVPASDGGVVGSISGRIIWGGPSPSAQIDRVYRDSGLCGEDVPSDELVISDESRSIEGVIVSLEGITRGKPLPSPGSLVIENRGCRFLPPMFVTIIGATLEIQNLDPVMHYTHARLDTRSGPTLWNVIQQAGAEGRSKLLDTQGLLDIRCDLHPNMKAFIQVLDHPYFDQTSFDGHFELRDVPPGSYTLKAWHPRFGAKTTPVNVPKTGGPITVDMLIQPR